MSDYTASDFRYAAQTYMADANLRTLLLAAAEQREQWDERDEAWLMKLTACSTASIQNTTGTRQERLTRDHPYWSVAYSDVCVAIDREIALREQLDAARANAELQSYGRRLAEDNQIRAYRLRDEAAEQIATLTAERDEARAKLTAMYTARDSRGNY